MSNRHSPSSQDPGQALEVRAGEPHLPRLRSAFPDDSPVLIDVNPRDGDELTGYLKVLARRKWIILGVALTVLTASAIRTYTETPIFEAVAKIRVDREGQVVPYADVYETVVGSADELQTQIVLLRSRSLARRVVQRLGGAQTPEQEGREIRSLLGRSSARPIPYTQVVELTYRSPDPELAASTANAIAEEYIQFSFETRLEAGATAREFLERELDDVRRQLRASQEALLKYTRENSELFLVSDSPDIVLNKLENLNLQLTEVEAQLISNRYQSSRGADATTLPPSLRTEAMRELELRLYNLEQNLVSLSTTFGPEWPAVRQTKNEIDGVRAQLQREVELAVEQERIEYELAEQHRRRLLDAIVAQNDLVIRAGEDAGQYAFLKREVETTQTLYDGLLQRLKEARVSAGLQSNNIQIIDRAEVPHKPSSPDIPVNLVLGASVGLVLGILAAFVRDYADQSVSSARDVRERLGLPALGLIPTLPELTSRTPPPPALSAAASPSPTWWSRDRFSRVQMPRVVPSAHDEALPEPRSTKQVPVFWEHYRSLRNWLLITNPHKVGQSVLVTSSVPGEGKTITSINLAVSLAQTGAKTVLVELDIYRPRLAELLNLPSYLGLSRYFGETGDLPEQLCETFVRNLSVLPAGPDASSVSDLIGSPAMRNTLEGLAREFQYVVVDSPPVLMATDAVVISRMVDGVVLVIRGDHTVVDTVREAQEHLRRGGANVMGAVVNHASPQATTDSYYYPVSSQTWEHHQPSEGESTP